MNVSYCILAIALALAGSAIAQTTSTPGNHAACHTQTADIERRMDVARSKGQMLLRAQLADQLATLQAGCQPLSPDQSRAANIQRLESEIQALKTDLEVAEVQLRKLKAEVNR